MNENNTQNVIPNVNSKGQEERNVPDLRFKRYDYPWVKIPLKNLLKFQNGINADSSKYGKGTKYISVTDILNNKYITYENIKGLINIDEATKNRFLVEYGDVLFQRSSETFLDIGRSNIYLDKERTATFGGFVIRGKKINDYDPLFLKYLLDSTNSRKKIIKMGAGAQHFNIGQEGLESIELYFPCKSEQIKIGELFSYLDDRIIAQKKIIEDIELLKKQLRNNIFTDDYGYFQPLKKLYFKGKAGGTPKTTNREYYDGDIPFLSITDITNSGKYIDNCSKKISIKGLENSSAWIVPAGSLILSMYASVGLPCINKIELATSQAMFSMILKKGINIDYIYEYLNYFKENKLEAYLEKGTQSNINSNIVENILIPLPDEKTIFKIVNILTSLDKKIDNEKSILQLYIKQKEYLLNKLFI